MTYYGYHLIIIEIFFYLIINYIKQFDMFTKIWLIRDLGVIKIYFVFFSFNN